MSKKNTKTITVVAEVVKVETPAVKIPAAEFRAIVLNMVKEYNTPMVPVTGNTFPVKGLIWTHGGTYDKEAKCWMVPAFHAKQMQEATDAVDAKIQLKIAERKAAKEAAAQLDQETVPLAVPV